MLIFPLLLPVLLLAQTTGSQTGAASAPKAAAPAAKTAPAAATAKAKPAAPAPQLTTDEQKAIYAVGLSMYRSLAPLDLSPAELALVQRAIADAAAGKPALDMNQWLPKIQPIAQARAARVAEKQKAASAVYLQKAAAERGAVKAESGLIYKELQPGTGPSPKPTDTVKVNYRGTLTDGTEFDSSYKRNQPAQFPLNGVIRCWTEGVQKMHVGGKAQLVCPSDIAYGNSGHPPAIPGGATLVFQIELLEIVTK
jgi:FKBP-type peptidyl-prolyl cis-trans isomerase FkpA